MGKITRPKPVKRDSFIFYKSFYDGIKELPEKDQILVLNCIMEYHFLGKEKSLSGIPSAIWKLIRPQLDSNNSKYINGLHPKIGSKPEAKRKQNVSKTEANVNGNVNEKENDNENGKATNSKKYFFQGDSFNITVVDSEVWLKSFSGYTKKSLFEKLEYIDRYYSTLDNPKDKPKNLFFSVSSWVERDKPQPLNNKPNLDEGGNEIVLW